MICLYTLVHNIADPSLTKVNLSIALEEMEDKDWRAFGSRVCFPTSLLNAISADHTNDKDRTGAIIDAFISSHPAPTWSLAAHALYQMHGGKESSHKALRHLQSKFPIGKY